MKGRGRITFWVFIVSTLLVVDVLAWAGWRMLALEDRNREQQVVRLALWRMDSIVTPIIAAEAARPYFHYLPAYPANRSYGDMFEPADDSDLLLPSPLLESALADDLIRLHYQIWPDGRFTSPQAPSETQIGAVKGVAVPDARRMFSLERLDALKALIGPVIAGERISTGRVGSGYTEQEEELEADSFAALASDAAPADPSAQLKTYDQEFVARQRVAEQAQKRSNEMNLAASKALTDDLAEEMKYAHADLDNGASMRSAGVSDLRRELAAVPLDRLGARADRTSGIDVGRFFAVWRFEGAAQTPQLVLERTVVVRGQRYVQGAWIDWPVLRQRLTDSVADLLPNAELTPAPDETFTSSMLATIPVRLNAGEIAGSRAGLFGSPARFTLVITGIAVGAAIVAIGFVLRASIVQGERRGQFVTAVTHELRTPLTTFRLYSQMLADGMVVDEAKRHRYLVTLKNEAERLSRIVENVLEYARLGGHSGTTIGGSVDADDLVSRMVPALRDRAEAGGFTLVDEADGPLEGRVSASPETVERILSNLVDNAIKYASGATDTRLHLAFRATGRGFEICFWDHGPGIPAGDRSRVFGAFQRAGRDASGPNPGLGLGLALARGMARQMGGDLRLTERPDAGAAFVLTLKSA